MKFKQIVLALALGLLTACSFSEPASETTAPPTEPSAMMDEMMSPVAVTFKLSGVNFAFKMDGKNNPDLVVKKGQRVTVEFTSEQGLHDFVVEGLDFRSEQVSTGAPLHSLLLPRQPANLNITAVLENTAQTEWRVISLYKRRKTVWKQITWGARKENSTKKVNVLRQNPEKEISIYSANWTQ
ncbi:hypothetical protein IPJ72_02195 [Candidatus Peregrinibacteria bacterium]|nr:MAG: hypothetical protein IPJ72_02195 [Candidatus Peregrinibacteria bacterium]